MGYPKTVQIVEVGPRDGLQNEKAFVDTQTKIAFVDKLSEAGLSRIEVTSFVKPEKIPQLRDNTLVYQGVKKYPNTRYSALVPNSHGLRAASAAHVTDIALLTAASDVFCERNINCSIEESFERMQTVVNEAKRGKYFIRGYISCTLGCPYSGEVKPTRVATLADRLLKLGCHEICLGDTIGIATPNHTERLIKAVKKKVPLKKIALHFHDTYGQALANIYASLQQGIRIFDSAISGLGGCPYAKGASGNVATEDVLYLLNGLGVKTGIDWENLLAAGQMIDEALDREPGSKVSRALALR